MRRRLSKSLFLLAAVMATGFLAAGCGKSGIGGAVASLAPSKSISLPTRSASDPPNSSDTPTPTPTITPTPTATPTPTPTLTPTATPSATPSASTAAPTPTSSPASKSGSSSSLIVLWVAIGALVLIGVMVLVVRSTRRSDTKASWQARASDAYSRGAAVHDAMSIAERRGALAEDAGPRWYDIQRRADDLAQMLYALRESAPDEDSRDRVADLITSLQATRSAMDAERAPGGAGPLQAEDVRRRLFSFEAALGALRPPDYGPR
jgi:hypothetical protein